MIDLVKREKSKPVTCSTNLVFLVNMVSKTLSVSASANSHVGVCSAPSCLPRARFWWKLERYVLPCTSNSSSAKHSPVPRVINSLLPFAILFKRGVRWNSAKQIASRIVVLPAPVGPVIANRPFSANGDWVKSSFQRPFKEFRFSNSRLKIFILVTLLFCLLLERFQTLQP